jgi:hypothetical protein
MDAFEEDKFIGNGVYERECFFVVVVVKEKNGKGMGRRNPVMDAFEEDKFIGNGVYEREFFFVVVVKEKNGKGMGRRDRKTPHTWTHLVLLRVP